MPGDSQDPRPETYALDALIQATIRRAQKTPGTQDAMLFLGNWHEAFPIRVVRDPVLEPVDKLVWMVVMLHARETGGRAAFPSYDTLAKQTNVASTSTIARAMAILRITRWLSLCARLRAKTGQFQGNVYVLHDEPLPLVDALYLDEDYMAFTRQSLQHHHARVRKVAKAVQDALAQDVREGHDPLAPAPVMEQRARSTLARQHQEEGKEAKANTGPRPFADYTEGVLQQLDDQTSSRAKARVKHRDQYSKAVENREVEGCSSSTLKTTTTTTNNTVKKMRGFEKDPLIFPARLSANQKALAEQYLATVPHEVRQSLLDELSGRIQAESIGAKPLYDELRFLFALCRAVTEGTFVPNLGLTVAESRARLLAQQEQVREPPPPKTPVAEADLLARKLAAQQHLGIMRQNLGLPPVK